MPAEPALKRTVVFVDGQNLFYAAKRAFGYSYPNYDVKQLAEAVCKQKGWELVQVRFYTGVPDVDERDSRTQFEAERWLEQAVGLDTASVAEAAISVVVETGDPIGRVVADHLTRHPEPELSSTLEPRV